MYAQAVYLTDQFGNPLVGSSGQPVTVAQLPATLGQKVMAASLSIAVASDQSTLPIDLAKGTRIFSTAAPTNAAASALAANTGRKEALISNAGTMIVYLGKDNTVTTANGLPLAPGATLRDDRATGAWWAIVASGTGDLRIIEVA